MLDYLVTSKARRTLLQLLWTHGRSGSVSELARVGNLSFRSAHKELNAMLSAGLAKCSHVGTATVFTAAQDHPGAEHLRFLLSPTLPERSNEETPGNEDEVRAWLKACGAPLEAGTEPANLPSSESVFVHGTKLATTDASVARSLPVFVWKNKHLLDHKRLRNEAHDLGVTHLVGFFLELTGRLGNDHALVNAAKAFRDHRRTKLRDFFNTTSSYERELATQRTPAVAKSWRYRMNMSMQTFSSTFEKFVANASIQNP